MTKHDIMGVLFGAPVLLLGLAALVVPWQGVILLLVAVGLFIPGQLYDHRWIRVLGFASMCLAVTILAYCVTLLGLGTYYLLSTPPHNGEMRWLMVAMVMFWCLTALILAIPGVWVMLKKLRLSRLQTAAGLGSGVAIALLVMLPVFFP